MRTLLIFIDLSKKHEIMDRHYINIIITILVFLKIINIKTTINIFHNLLYLIALTTV